MVIGWWLPTGLEGFEGLYLKRYIGEALAKPAIGIEELLTHPGETLLSQQDLPANSALTRTTTPDVAPRWKLQRLDDTALRACPGLFRWLVCADIGKRTRENAPNFL